MSSALLLSLALLAQPTAAVPNAPVTNDAVAAAPATAATAAPTTIRSGDLTVRTGNGCSPIEGQSFVPVMPDGSGPMRFERKLWLNLREEIHGGAVRVEQTGNHLKAIVDYSVADIEKGKPLPTCLYEAELTLQGYDLPTGEYELEFSKAPKPAPTAAPAKP